MNCILIMVQIMCCSYNLLKEKVIVKDAKHNLPNNHLCLLHVLSVCHKQRQMPTRITKHADSIHKLGEHASILQITFKLIVLPHSKKKTCIYTKKST